MFLRIPDSNLLIAGVSAIGRKFPGDDGSSLVKLFGITLTAATFQLEGTVPSMMTVKKIDNRRWKKKIDNRRRKRTPLQNSLRYSIQC